MSALAPWLGRCASAACALVDCVATPRLSILIFHRVLPAPDPIFPDEIDVARFDALMGLLSRTFRVLPLGAALRLREDGRLPPRALAITFDDGYADNVTLALPVLQRYGVQATVFVATGFLDGGRMFNDSVIECIRRTEVATIDLGAFGLGVHELATPAQRRQTIETLLPKAKYLGLAEREQFVDRLLHLAGRPMLPNDLMMRSEQVAALHRAGIEIGAHTVRHPILRLVADDEAEREITDGAERLRDITGAPVGLFAYPNGKPMQDYDARHVAMVRRLGFRAAVSTAPGVVNAQADLHQLPRFTPWDRAPLPWLARLMRERLRSGAAATATAAQPA